MEETSLLPVLFCVLFGTSFSENSPPLPTPPELLFGSQPKSQAVRVVEPRRAQETRAFELQLELLQREKAMDGASSCARGFCPSPSPKMGSQSMGLGLVGQKVPDPSPFCPLTWHPGGWVLLLVGTGKSLEENDLPGPSLEMCSFLLVGSLFVFV